MSNNNERVKVKITIGEATVEVEADPEQLEEAVRKVVSALRPSGVEAVQQAREERRRGLTCRELIERLVEEGWFESSRTLSEVSQELARRGYFYDPTAVAHSLLDLVRMEVLVREGNPRRYVYTVKKATGLESKGQASVERDNENVVPV